MTRTTVRYGYADTPLGQLHYAEAGGLPGTVPGGDPAASADGSPVPILLLHQTPRSLDEYRELLPLLAAHRRTIAMDMYGFGQSAKPAGDQSIAQYAEGALALADALGIERFTVLGHHTGFYAAMETAVRAPARVAAAVLSAGKYMDAEFRARAHGPVVDGCTRRADGAHLQELWRGRAGLYPAGRPDLLDRYVRDALAPGIDPQEGHRAVGRYRMDERADLLAAPVLVLAPTLDPVSAPHTERLRTAFPRAERTRVVEIPGGRIPLMEEKSIEVAAAVTAFLDELGI